MTYAPEYLAPLSEAVGRVIIEWNRIEHVIAELAHRLAGCISAPLIGPSGDVLRLALMNMDLRARISTTKAYAFQCQIYDGFYAELEKILNRVDNELRAERNKFVHSLWYCDFGQPSRVAIGTRIVKPQAGMLELVTSTSRDYSSIDEAAIFGAELAEAYNQIAAIEGKVSLSEAYKNAQASLAVRA